MESTSDTTQVAESGQQTAPHAEQHILEQRVQVEQMLNEVRVQRAELLLERRLQESILPAAVKEQVRARFAGRVFEESELEAGLSAALAMMAQLTRDGLVRGPGYEKHVVGQIITEAE